MFIPKRLSADEVVATDAAAGRATEEVWAGAKASAPAMRATAMVAAVNFMFISSGVLNYEAVSQVFHHDVDSKKLFPSPEHVRTKAKLAALFCLCMPFFCVT